MNLTRTALAAVVLLIAGLSHAAPVPPPGRSVDIRTPDYEFSYSYPAAAGRVPALKAWLDQDASAQRARIASEARAGRVDAKGGGFPFNPYFSSAEWKVVTDLPGWLSLSGMRGDYTGGAHSGPAEPAR